METDNRTQIKEVDYINIARALGIILIVLGHATEPSLFNNFINLFHVPLFFFISGYLFKEAYFLKPAYFIKIKLKRFYLPFIKYELLFLIFHNIFLKLNLYNQAIIPFYSIKDFFLNALNIITFGESESAGPSLWFLVSLFMVNMLFFIVSYALYKNKFNKNNNELPRFIIIIILFIAGNIIVSRQIEIARRIDGALIALAIFYLGYLYQKIEKSIEKYKILNLKFTLISTLLLIFNALYIKTEVSLYTNQYSNPAAFVLFAILGIYATLYLSKILEKSSINKILCYIGKNTIPILALHILSFKIINLILIILYKLPIYFLSARTIKSMDPFLPMLYATIGISIPLKLISVKNKAQFIAQKIFIENIKN